MKKVKLRRGVLSFSSKTKDLSQFQTPISNGNRIVSGVDHVITGSCDHLSFLLVL